jgi:hypothetical protein
MPKKCIPGVICIENMTFLILVIVIFLVSYVIYSQNKKEGTYTTEKKDKIVIVQQPALASISARVNPPLNDPYYPPVKDDGYFFPKMYGGDIRGGIPINIETRGTGMSYEQVGILTPTSSQSDGLILPLMGRRTMTGRSNWQYYTVANGIGSINAKLPIRKNGRSCSGEYGCDDIQNGENVYVEGYKTTFTVTLYDNNNLSYIPYL